jgi:hypothetical protein
MFYTVIQANKEQAAALFEKHLKTVTEERTNWIFMLIPVTTFVTVFKIKRSSFSYDDEDNIGFVKLETTTKKTVEYQLRDGEPCYVQFTGFGKIRYDISSPKRLNKDLYEFLKEQGKLVSENFWAGGEI